MLEAWVGEPRRGHQVFPFAARKTDASYSIQPAEAICQPTSFSVDAAKVRALWQLRQVYVRLTSASPPVPAPACILPAASNAWQLMATDTDHAPSGRRGKCEATQAPMHSRNDTAIAGAKGTGHVLLQ